GGPPRHGGSRSTAVLRGGSGGGARARAREDGVGPRRLKCSPWDRVGPGAAAQGLQGAPPYESSGTPLRTKERLGSRKRKRRIARASGAQRAAARQRERRQEARGKGATPAGGESGGRLIGPAPGG